ncbi:MAG: hypothetical protein IT426_15860 [Pirellulales bacterium]|nr:hypothetical protein [Pirellulales bacterium]
MPDHPIFPTLRFACEGDSEKIRRMGRKLAVHGTVKVQLRSIIGRMVFSLAGPAMIQFPIGSDGKSL